MRTQLNPIQDFSSKSVEINLTYDTETHQSRMLLNMIEKFVSKLIDQHTKDIKI